MSCRHAFQTVSLLGLVLVMGARNIQAGQIEGDVAEAFSRAIGKPTYLAGVIVKAKLPDQTVVTAEGDTTGRMGEYRILNLPAGLIEVSFSHVGYLEDPTLIKVTVDENATVKLNADLVLKDADSQFYGELARLAASQAENSTNGYKVEYQHLWTGLHRTQVPVAQKSMFANQLAERDHRALTAIPALPQYLNLDAKMLQELTREVDSAIQKGQYERIRDLDSLRRLPAAVYGDLLVQSAFTKSPEGPASANRILDMVLKDADPSQKAASRELFQIKEKSLPRKLNPRINPP